MYYFNKIIMTIFSLSLVITLTSCCSKETCVGPVIDGVAFENSAFIRVYISEGCSRSCTSAISGGYDDDTRDNSKVIYVNFLTSEVSRFVDNSINIDEYSSNTVENDSISVKIEDADSVYNATFAKLSVNKATIEFNPINAFELYDNHIYTKMISDSIVFINRGLHIALSESFLTLNFSYGSKFRIDSHKDVFYAMDYSFDSNFPKVNHQSYFSNVGGRDISLWNNAVYAYNDFYGVDAKSIDTAYFYKYSIAEDKWDSLLIDLKPYYQMRINDSLAVPENINQVTLSIQNSFLKKALFAFDSKKDLVLNILDDDYGMVIDSENMSINHSDFLEFTHYSNVLNYTYSSDSLRITGSYKNRPFDLTFKDWMSW